MRADGFVSPETRWFDVPEPVRLECGQVLSSVRVSYRTWGRLAPDGGNAVLVCHALTGSADADAWWPALFGPGKALDPTDDFIVCSNVLGSCYGTTGPTSQRPGGAVPFGPDFPGVTVRDMVRLQALLVEWLGVRRLRLVLGGSLGGMQVLEWALLYPERVESLAPIAVSGRHSAWCIGLSEAQRQAIYTDPQWNGGRYAPGRPPAAGLAVARMIAMCSYRSRRSFELRFGRARSRRALYEVERYLGYQGQKLAERFDANSYVTLTRAMDSHDVARGRGDYEAVLRSVRHRMLVVAIDSDVLYPPEEQEELVALLPNADLALLHSVHGHDGFLVDAEALNALLVRFRPSRGAPPPAARLQPGGIA
jgi:homoserine O-acetyltransferase